MNIPTLGWLYALTLSMIMWAGILACGQEALANGDYIESSPKAEAHADASAVAAATVGDLTVNLPAVSSGGNDTSPIYALAFSRPMGGGGPDGCTTGVSAAGPTGGGSLSSMDPLCGFRVAIETLMMVQCKGACGVWTKLNEQRVDALLEASTAEALSRTSWFGRLWNHVPILGSL